MPPTTLNPVNVMPRINYYQTVPEPFNKLFGITQYLESSSLDSRLRALVELRVSQMNGCAYCVDLHTREARKLGESQACLDMLTVWTESPFFDERERAALAWAESLTQIHRTHAPDGEYAALKQYFSDREIVDLSLAISITNTWNRIAIAFRKTAQ